MAGSRWLRGYRDDCIPPGNHDTLLGARRRQGDLAISQAASRFPALGRHGCTRGSGHPLGARQLRHPQASLKIAKLMRRERHRVHFTPIDSGLRNPVERWFGPLSQQATSRLVPEHPRRGADDPRLHRCPLRHRGAGHFGCHGPVDPGPNRSSIYTLFRTSQESEILTVLAHKWLLMWEFRKSNGNASGYIAAFDRRMHASETHGKIEQRPIGQ